MLQTEALPGTLIKLDEYTLQTATENTDGQALATTTTTEPMTTTMVAGTATTAALKDAVPESFGTSKVQEGADDPANTTRVIESSPENSKIAIFEFTKGESKYIVDKFKKIANSRNEAQDLSDIQGLGISNRDFIDFKGRKVYIRGINVGGHCKLPYSPKEDKNEYENGVFVGDGGFGRASHELNGFYDHRSVSFVNRPFKLEEAALHFRRLKSWGLVFVRLIVPWEALEHEGPGIYDKKYIAYLKGLLKIMHNEGLKCIIDPHQDMWSRYCGGSGAPGWTLEVAGLEMRNFKDTGAALVHCEARTEEESAPKMMWVTNATKLATSTMFTVFFGGKIFAPKAKIDGVNIQDFLQGCYIRCYQNLAKNIKNCKAVVGFEAMNEPESGYLGMKTLRRYDGKKHLLLGESPTPLEQFTLGDGEDTRIRVYKPWWPKPSRFERFVNINKNNLRAWKDGVECIWKRHGVWGRDENGTAVLLKEDYFYKDPTTHEPVSFNKLYKEFLLKYYDAINNVCNKWIIFLEPQPNTVPPTFEGGELGGNVAYAPHWYDLYSLFNKKFEGKISYNVLELQNSINIIKHVYFGKKGAVSNYTKQLDLVRRRGLIHVGETPTIIGECGIPMDINGRAAYKTDDYKYQIIMMDSLMKAMENTCLGFTLWNYNPFNDNDFGDYWNGEDFSVASRSSIRHGEDLDKYDKNKVIGMRNRPKKMGRLNKNYQRDLITLNNGGRVLEAIIRPYITRMRQCIELNKTKFRYKKKRFTFRVTVSNRECRKLQMYNSNGMEHGMGFGFGNSDIANGNRNGVNGGSGDNNAGTALAKSGSWMYSLVPTRKSLKEGSVELGRSMFSGNLKYLNRIGRRGFNSVINIYTGGSGTGGGENERSNRYSDSITINSDGSSDRASSHNTETRTDYCRSLISNSSGDEVSTRDGGSQWRFRLPSLDFSLKTPERIREKVMRISGSSGSSGGSSDGGGDLEPNSTTQLILAKTENRRDLVDGKPRGTLEYQDGDAGNGGNQDNNSSGSDSDRDIPEDDEHGIVVGGESDDNYNEEQAGSVDDYRGEKKGGKMRYINTRITNKIIEKSSDGVKKLSMKSKSMYRPIELGRLYFSGTGGDNDKKKADTFDGALKDTRPNALGLTNDNKPPQLYSLPSPSMSSSTPALHNVRSADLNDSEKHNSDFPNEKARNNSGTRGKRSERKRGAAVENKIMGFVNEHIGSYSLAIYVPHYHYGNSPLQIVVRTKEGPKLNYSYCYVPQLQSLFLKFSPLATNVKSLINVTIKKKNKFSRNHKMFSTFDKQEFLKSESGNGGNGGNTGSSVSSTTINNSPTTPTTPINDIPNILPMDIGAGGNESTTKNDHTASTPPNNSSNGSFTGGKNNENEKQSPSGTTVLNKKLMMFQIGKSFYYHPDITNSNLAGNNSNNRMNTKDNGGVSTTSNEIVVRNEHTFKPSSQPGLNKPDTKNGNNADKSTQDTKNGDQKYYFSNSEFLNKKINSSQILNTCFYISCTGEDQNVRNNNGNAQTEKKDDKAGGNEQNLDGCGLVSSFIF